MKEYKVMAYGETFTQTDIEKVVKARTPAEALKKANIPRGRRDVRVFIWQPCKPTGYWARVIPAHP